MDEFRKGVEVRDFMDELRYPPRITEAQLTKLAFGVDRPEGLCILPDGRLFVGGSAGQLYEIRADNSASQVATTNGFLLGLAADAASRLYACDMGNHCVWRFDSSNWSREVFTSGAPGEPLNIPNWGAFGPDGTYYLSDSGGAEERGGTTVAHDGKILTVRHGTTQVWSRESAYFPNGMAVSPDGKELFVAESYPGRLVKFGILADGSADHRQVVAELLEVVPDGISFASDGSVIIACYRPDVILRWDPIQGIEVLANDRHHRFLVSPTNCAFYGSDLGMIAIPNIGADFVTRFSVEGLRGAPLVYPTPSQVGS